MFGFYSYDITIYVKDNKNKELVEKILAESGRPGNIIVVN